MTNPSSESNQVRGFQQTWDVVSKVLGLDESYKEACSQAYNFGYQSGYADGKAAGKELATAHIEEKVRTLLWGH